MKNKIPYEKTGLRKSRNPDNALTCGLILNNRKLNRARREKFQRIKSEPEFIKVGEYKTKSGQTKIRYERNPNSIIIKLITHKYKRS
jgi:hypothetical protein